jgi:hypothetical protein
VEVNELLGRVEEYKKQINEKGKKLSNKMFYQSKMKESDLKARERFIIGQQAFVAEH